MRKEATTTTTTAAAQKMNIEFVSNNWTHLSLSLFNNFECDLRVSFFHSFMQYDQSDMGDIHRVWNARRANTQYFLSYAVVLALGIREGKK